MREEVIKTNSNNSIHAYVWDKTKNPKGVLLIIHGMQTHAGRYCEMGDFFASHGYYVYACDLKGHGKNVKNNQWGVGEKDLFAEIVQDEINISKYIKEKHNLPLFVFAHSYGSFVAQEYMQNYNGFEKMILSGTRYTSGADVGLGVMWINFLDFINKKDKRLVRMEKLAKKVFGWRFQEENWYTRDLKLFDKLKKDKLCNHAFPISFYDSMFEHMKKMYKNIAKQDKTKPIFIAVGGEDPVGNNGKLAKKLFKFYRKNHINTEQKIYEGARHEMFTDTKRQDFFEDVLKFIES